MLRGLSKREGRRDGYDRLLEDSSGYNGTADHDHDHHAQLKRIASVPAKLLFGSSAVKLKHVDKQEPTPVATIDSAPKANSGVKGGKINHPVFSLFDKGWKKKKKMTSNPDFSRYLEYVREGGVWNKDASAPTIYYK